MSTVIETFDLRAAPIRIGKVGLKVRDLAEVSAFYQRVLGLKLIDKREAAHTLGTASTPLLELVGDPTLAPRDPSAAGLFHIAFLLPTREDLARWLSFAVQNRMLLQGASDHIVSEAIYLADPEGNGIEVYADHPISRWRAADGELQIATEPLDVDDLLSAVGDVAWAGFPAGGSIGHVHLQVGDTAAAEGFYRDVLGFDVASRYPGASFFGSGGYHHQLAGNVWNSRRAGPRSGRMAGLDRIELVVRDASQRESIIARAESAGIQISTDGGDPTLFDPWGNALSLAN